MTKRKRKGSPIPPSTPTPQPYNVFDAIIHYEHSELTYDEVVEMFQYLVDSGLAWKLQGHYGRTASILLRTGDILAPTTPCPNCGLPYHHSNAETLHRSCAGYVEYGSKKGILK